MIYAVVLAAMVAGQPQPRPVPVPAKAQAKARGDAQRKKQVESKRAKKAAADKAFSRFAAASRKQDAIDYEAQVKAQEKAMQAQLDYVAKMGPIWAAEHANQIQQQRNALIAEQNQIAQRKAAYDAWILWQLTNRPR